MARNAASAPFPRPQKSSMRSQFQLKKTGEKFRLSFYNADGKRIDICEVVAPYMERGVRTVSVKEVATALGLTPRAVIYRIEKGDLKGTRTANSYGVQEWRIYPNKEILEKLKQPNPSGTQTTGADLDFEPSHGDAVDAETVSFEEEQEQTGSWIDQERERMRILAEEITRPLIDTIRQQERVIEEQKRELRLLPDLEKKASEQDKAVELKQFEIEALNKQLQAIQARMDEIEKATAVVPEPAAEKAPEVSQEDELRAKAAELEELARKEQEEARQAQEKVVILEKELEQATSEAAKKLEVAQKELERLKRPWWVRLFSTPEE